MSQSKPLSSCALLLNSVAIVAAVAVLAGDFRRNPVPAARQQQAVNAPSRPGLEEILRIAKSQLQNWHKNQS